MRGTLRMGDTVPTYLTAADPAYYDGLVRLFRSDPRAVDPQWRAFFEGVDVGARPGDTAAEAPPVSLTGAAGSTPLEFNVLNLIHAYRTRGHLFTRTNPVRSRRKYEPTLDLANFDLSESHLDTVFQAGAEVGLGPAPLLQIVGLLEETYCRSIGAEFMYLRVPERVQWLVRRMECTRNAPRFSPERKLRVYGCLSRAVLFENFLHSRYVGQKRFALCGGETLIPALDTAVWKGAELGAREFVLGMAHRGRLNTLVNVMGKPPRDVFEEFDQHSWLDEYFAGDVKYHLGYRNTSLLYSGDEVLMHLLPNPSHLEAVAPVVEGFARSRIDHAHGGDLGRLIPVLVHGDAALAAQGVVYEVVQMSLLDAYRTGGTLHIAVNNQVGFTTNYLDARSSTYCTDVAKVTLSPVFHVNADDVEAVALATEMAVEYRQRFHTDVFIDLLGYRRYGHNESDEPRFTQPKLYKVIAQHPNPMEIYRRALAEEGAVPPEELSRMDADFGSRLQADLGAARDDSEAHRHYKDFCDRRTRPGDLDLTSSPPTGVHAGRLSGIARNVFQIPETFQAFDKIRKIYDARMSDFFERGRVDWAMGEALAYASLLADGVHVRVAGQDVERGTFSHRHAVLLDEETEEEYVPLQNAAPGQGRFSIHNSLLSEYAALGFEYGYSRACPEGLTIWEAQFGDFANGAQVVLDQYLSSAEAKWNELNGLVLLLPHGYEGQGADHSSARVERFIELCANGNMLLLNCTTPASFFHALRRHMALPARVPLVCFTPKSLLRHPQCSSTATELSEGAFRPVIDDPGADPASVRQVVLCSGKVYYDLARRRAELGATDSAIVRLEQVYPLPEAALEVLVKKYARAVWRWVQEEPANMGAGHFVVDRLAFMKPPMVARREGASTASGFHDIHELELQDLMRWAFENPFRSRT